MYLNTTSLQRTSESEIRSAFPNTSFPQPFSPPEGYAVLFATPQPAFDLITQTVREVAPAVSPKGNWEQRWEVVDLDAEVIAVNQAAKAEADSKALDAKYNALWSAADKYVAGYISGVAIGLLTVGVLQAKPKAHAITAWSSAVWAEYYVRKALVTLTSDDNLDFSTLGPMPHSVPELQAEVGL